MGGAAPCWPGPWEFCPDTPHSALPSRWPQPVTTCFPIVRQFTTLRANLITIPSPNPPQSAQVPSQSMASPLHHSCPCPPFFPAPQQVLLILPPISPVPPPISISTATTLAQPSSLSHAHLSSRRVSVLWVSNPYLGSTSRSDFLWSIFHTAVGAVTSSVILITVSHRAFAHAVPALSP